MMTCWYEDHVQYFCWFLQIKLCYLTFMQHSCRDIYMYFKEIIINFNLFFFACILDIRRKSKAMCHNCLPHSISVCCNLLKVPITGMFSFITSPKINNRTCKQCNSPINVKVKCCYRKLYSTTKSFSKFTDV